MRTSFAIAAVTVAVSLSCQEPADERATRRDAVITSSTEQAAGLGSDPKPLGKTIVTGTLVIQPDPEGETLPAGEAMVYLEGFGDAPAQTKETGQFQVEIPDAVFALAGGTTTKVTWGASHKHGDAYFGIRQDDVTLVKGEENALQEVRLVVAAAVQGVAQMDGAASHAGIVVRIPGTPFKTTTDAEGRYMLPGVPPAADWSLELVMPGYKTVASEAFPLESGETHPMPASMMEKEPSL